MLPRWKQSAKEEVRADERLSAMKHPSDCLTMTANPLALAKPPHSNAGGVKQVASSGGGCGARWQQLQSS
jgi:hypothetical protein